MTATDTATALEISRKVSISFVLGKASALGFAPDTSPAINERT
jgi:hypothetical protein